jgi:hypothetical protein
MGGPDFPDYFFKGFKCLAGAALIFVKQIGKGVPGIVTVPAGQIAPLCCFKNDVIKNNTH